MALPRTHPLDSIDQSRALAPLAPMPLVALRTARGAPQRARLNNSPATAGWVAAGGGRAPLNPAKLPPHSARPRLPASTQRRPRSSWLDDAKALLFKLAWRRLPAPARPPAACVRRVPAAGSCVVPMNRHSTGRCAPPLPRCLGRDSTPDGPPAQTPRACTHAPLHRPRAAPSRRVAVTRALWHFTTSLYIRLHPPAPSVKTATMLMAMRTLALAALPMLTHAHSNVIVPRPRNAIDALTDSRFGSCSVGKGCAPLNDGRGHCGYGQR